MKARNRFLLSMLVTTFLFLSSFSAVTTAANSGSVHICLPDSSSGVFLGGTVTGKLVPSTQMHATVALKFNNQGDLNNLLSGLQTPSSTLYHKFLTHDQFVREFSPSSSEYNGYVQYFRSQGFSVKTYSDRASMDLAGSAALFESTFHTSIDNVAYLDRTFYAPTSPLWISYGSLGDIAGITGLSDRIIPKLAPLFTGNGSNQLLYGPDMQNAYQLNKLYSANGYPTNETIATILWSGENSSHQLVGPYVPSDVYTYLNSNIPSGQPISTIFGYPVDGAPAPGPSAAYDITSADIESTLDLEMAASTAPGATVVEVYASAAYTNYLDDAFASILNPSYNSSVDTALSHVVAISNSWGGSDYNDTAWSQDEQEAAALGITVLASSGDSGNYQDPNASFPATDSNSYYGITAVGGAQMVLNGNSSTNGSGTTGIATQSVWYNTPNPGNGTQGGVSSVFAEPSWQLHSSDANSVITGASNVTNVSSGRGTPDISGDGANMKTYLTNIYLGGAGNVELWGTSIASPSVAGEIATMVHYLGEREGFMDPLIYELGQAEYNGSFSASKPFYFISNGSNYYFSGENGYSLAVGWGSINAYNFAQDQRLIVSKGYAVTFSAFNLNSGAPWYVNISGEPSSGPIQASNFTVYLPNGTYQFTVETVDKDYQPSYANSVKVSGNSTSVSIYFSLVAYAITFDQTNLTSGASWYVNITGYSTYGEYLYTNSGPITGSNFSVQYPNGTYYYNISSNNPNETAVPVNGSFTVAGTSPPTIQVYFSTKLYSVEFLSSGLPSGSWYVNTSGQSVIAPAGSAIYYFLPNGTFQYTISTNNKIYGANGGYVTVSGNSVVIQVNFSAITYDVQFTQTGLTTGFWYINLTGTEQDGSNYSSQSGSLSSSVTYLTHLSNGTYYYSVATTNGQYDPNAFNGSFGISGGGDNISITFSQVIHNITFAESGLLSGNWYVNVTGTKSGFYSGPISSPSITVYLANGTYTYTISEDNKSFAPTPDSGTFQTSALPLTVNIVFSLETYTYVFTSTGLVSGIWYLNFSGQSKSAPAGSSISYNLANGSHSYTTSTDDKIYAPFSYSGTIAVSGKQTSPMNIAYHIVTFSIPFSETGLGSGVWYVNLTGTESDGGPLNMNSSALINDTFSFSVPNGSYSYRIARSNLDYQPSSYHGSFTVSGKALSSTNIIFSLVRYSLSFNETGYSGIWFVNITSGSTIINESGPISGSGYTVELPNGTYAVTISYSGHYIVSYPGSVTISGSNAGKLVVFEQEFLITFSETGLPNGTSWSVTLNGVNKSSTTGSITFLLLNGTYSYSIGGVSSYDANLTSGTLVVQGQHITEQISFSSHSKENPPPTNPRSYSDQIFYIIGIVVAVLIVTGVVIAVRRRR